MLKSNKNNQLASLVKQVRALNFDKVKNLGKLQVLLSAIYDEFSRFKNKHYINSINKKLCAKYKAEEDIIIGLLFVLQEKSIEYISKIRR